MMKKNERGQVALILVLMATVAGTLVISLADRSTRDLRTQSLDTEKVKALKGAESGVEQALLNQSSLSQTDLGDNLSFEAEYSREGGDGLVSADLINPGGVFDVLVDGADSDVNMVRIFFSSESSVAALKISEYKFDAGIYSINSYAFDGDTDRALLNGFSDLVNGSGFVFKDINFTDRVEVSIDPAATKFLRVTVLYAATRIGVNPVGGNLPGQQVVISSVGSYSASADSSVKKRLELRKETEGLPVIFDRVLYSNSKLIQ